MRLEVLDSLSDPAKPGGENEDRIGWNASAAFVIDGATSLGDPVVAPPASDAAWIAEWARERMAAGLAPDRSLREIVRDLSAAARAQFFASAAPDVERYRHPSASFQSLRLTEAGLEIAGLGDCTLFLRDGAGSLTRYSGLRAGRSGEQSGARMALNRMGGLNAAGEGFRDAETLAALRASRARHNTAGGVWTLGIHPEAGEHVRIEMPEAPMPALGLLCSDGFADILDNYALHTTAGLMDRAERNGLAPLLAEIRRIERDIDPNGLQFPRYKRSDDASAVLVRVSG
ncbi:protein phosphatase 2C domain-containing protein [Dongia sp.]|uniref:protein phosphatase 2C domain-containing protein n=1 Tax=Dongia sp. TaxID=1977262 RepID=UPI003750CC7F